MWVLYVTRCLYWLPGVNIHHDNDLICGKLSVHTRECYSPDMKNLAGWTVRF